MSYGTERDALLKIPCQCISCPDCKGRGVLWTYRGDVYPDEEMETCDYCEGSGISERCDRCQERTELDDLPS